jgi:hypothetical protein
MTSPKAETLSSPLFRSCRITLTVIVFMLAVGSSPARAQPATPETRTPKSESQAKKPRPALTGQPKPAGAKAKARARGTAQTAKPANESTAQAPDAGEKAPVTPSVGTSETVNFEIDADDKKMEPGYELIQGAPRRARHRSLVPASPSPEDSVVNRQ